MRATTVHHKRNRGILETLDQDPKERERVTGLTSMAWALSVTETARSIT